MNMQTQNLADFDMAEYLNSEQAIAEYISQVLADGDSSELAAALGHIAKARGMTEIAKSSGIAREALYKALRPGAQPRLDTIQKVCKALGIKLTATTA